MKSTPIIATILAAALVSASAIPALSAKNTGAFQQSAEANHFLQSACADYKILFQADVDAMNKAQKGSKEYKDAREQANDILGTAWRAGCGWAQ